MKTTRLILAATMLLTIHASALRAENAAPAVSIQKAIEIAEQAKLMRDGGDRVYIEKIELQRTSLLNAKDVWIVKWSGKLPANKPEDREIGLQIFMDGHVKHIVKGPADK